MRSVIIYASVHHNNTMKLVEAIATEHPTEVDIIDATKTKTANLSGYDLIGFASGIYYGKFHEDVLAFAKDYLPEGKKVFLMCTCGGKAVYKSMEEIIENKAGIIVGRFSSKGYDTFGPFKLIGGISKGHPDENDIKAAKDFFKSLNV